MRGGPKIFICYRREDTGGHAGHLYHSLRRRFGNDAIYFDRVLPGGTDFRASGLAAIAACKVVLVLIGPRWAERDRSGHRRLDDPEDLVRLEIERSLERPGLQIVPILVEQADMPPVTELPVSIAGMAGRHACELSNARWNADVGDLLAIISRGGGPTSGPLWRLADRIGALPRWLSLLAALAVLAAIVVAVTSRGDGPRAPPSRAGGAPQAHALPPIKIGVLYPLSGKNRSAGNDAYDGVRLALRYVNDGAPAGVDLRLVDGKGLPFFPGVKVEAVHADSRSDPCEAGHLFNELVRRKGAVAVVGAYESTVTLQGIRAAEELPVPFVSEGATDPSFTFDDHRHGDASNPCHLDPQDVTPSKWFFRVGPNEDRSRALYRDFLRDQFRGVLAEPPDVRPQDGKTVVTLSEVGDAYGEAAEAAAKKATDALGPRVRLIGRYHYHSILHPRPGDEDAPCAYVAELKKALTTIRGLDPDVLFVVSFEPDAVSTMQLLGNLHYAPRALLAFGAGYEDAGYVSDTARMPTCGLSAGNPFGVITRAAWAPRFRGQSETSTLVAKDFKRIYRHDMTSNSARSFTATLALVEAVNDAGSREPNAIREALHDLYVPADRTIMPWDGIRFDDDGQNTLARFLLEQRRRCGDVVVFGGSYATDGAILPLKRARAASC